MKINGKPLLGPRVVKLHLFIEEGQAVELKFRCLTAQDDFEKIMPRPKPPELVKPGGERLVDVEDATFKAALLSWATHKIDWEFLQSISATDGLEWESVNMSEPSTWGKWREDLEKYFGTGELNKIFQKYMEANMLTEDVMDEARKSFLASQVTPLEK
jgi:hypothetical protein